LPQTLPPFEDDFNRPNSTNLGAKFVEQVGDFSIVSNKLKANGALNIASYTGLSYFDGIAQLAIDPLQNGQYAGVYGRYTGPGDTNMYWAGLVSNGNGTFYRGIFRNLNGNWTLIGSANM